MSIDQMIQHQTVLHKGYTECLSYCFCEHDGTAALIGYASGCRPLKPYSCCAQENNKRNAL